MCDDGSGAIIVHLDGQRIHSPTLAPSGPAQYIPRTVSSSILDALDVFLQGHHRCGPERGNRSTDKEAPVRLAIMLLAMARATLADVKLVLAAPCGFQTRRLIRALDGLWTGRGQR